MRACASACANSGVRQVVQSIPTIGFNVETVEYKNLKFMVWDIGGQDRIRNLWRHYYNGTQGANPHALVDVLPLLTASE